MGMDSRGCEDGARMGSCKLKGQVAGRHRCARGEDLGYVCRPRTRQQLGSLRRQLRRVEVDTDINELRRCGLCSIVHAQMLRGDAYRAMGYRTKVGTVPNQNLL